MTPTELGVSPEYQWLATAAGAIAVGILAAWGRWRGKAEGVPKPVVTEFAMTGAIADMKPIRDLVEEVRELSSKIGAQVVADGRTAAALEALAQAYSEQIESQKDEQRINAEIERRLTVLQSRRGAAPRAPRKGPTKPG